MGFQDRVPSGNSNVSLSILLLLSGSDARGDIVGIG